MNTSHYSEKLKHPKWQKKRLEILERDKWKCTRCRGKEDTLHVHHLTYEFEKDPWDYKNSNFVTLCKFCHNDEHLMLNHQKVLKKQDMGESKDYINRLFNSHDKNFESICCPFCGFNYVHIVDCKNIRGEDSGKAWSGRGDKLEIEMWCENHHLWKMSFGFHKGFTMAFIEEPIISDWPERDF